MFFYSTKKYIGRQYGEYTVIKSVGEGRYGMCYLAHSTSGEIVIIKRFKPSIFKKNKEKNAYEAVILSQLNHKAIPELLGVVNKKGFYGFVLEQKSGYTVKDMLFKHNRCFSYMETFNIGTQLIDIIKCLHDKGVVHRDIRIPNVIVDNGKVFLVDFGLARWVDNDRYKYDIDFSYLGDFLLYLLYSTYTAQKKKRLPWYQELPLSPEQKTFLKKLLRLENSYESIDEVKKDFIEAFCISEN